MSGPQSSHPRRRPYNKAAPPALLASSNHGEALLSHHARPQNLKLIKGATFHGPTTSPTEECDPILYIPCLPRRAPTSSNALEEVLAAGQRRVADILGKVDQKFGGDERLPLPDSASTQDKSQFASNDFPIPRGLLDCSPANTDTMDIDTAPNRPCFDEKNRLAPLVNKIRPLLSDSGVGSSVSELSLNKRVAQGNLFINPCNLAISRSNALTSTIVSRLTLRNSERGAVNRSVACTTSDSVSPKVHLSPAASKQIERCILVPILRKPEFKSFHVLARSVPQRVKQNNITCLRDLEKTLLLLAPVSDDCPKVSKSYAHLLPRNTRIHGTHSSISANLRFSVFTPLSVS